MLSVRLAAMLALLACFTASAPAAAQAGPACADFDAYEWGQSVYDGDPDENAALDPDGDGVACP
ncbi:MAG: hypothetical protein M3Q10_07510, partial [Chloroflexota bacterium]|nr:hypothetical protein [Chloroflexota bacterium]